MQTKPFGERHDDGHKVMEEVNAEITEMAERWPLLDEGLFRGSADRLTEAVKGLKASIRGY